MNRFSFTPDFHRELSCGLLHQFWSMTQFWSIKYICLVYKLKFLLWTCPKLLYLELYFLVLFGDCGNLFFDGKFSKFCINVFFISKKGQNCFYKNFYNSGMVSRRKLPDPSLGNVFNHLSIGLRYTLSFEWSDIGLTYLVTVLLKGQPPKFKGSV